MHAKDRVTIKEGIFYVQEVSHSFLIEFQFVYEVKIFLDA